MNHYVPGLSPAAALCCISFSFISWYPCVIIKGIKCPQNKAEIKQKKHVMASLWTWVVLTSTNKIRLGHSEGFLEPWIDESAHYFTKKPVKITEKMNTIFCNKNSQLDTQQLSWIYHVKICCETVLHHAVNKNIYCFSYPILKHPTLKTSLKP